MGLRRTAMAHAMSDWPRSFWVESGGCQAMRAFLIDDGGAFHYDNR